VKRLKQGPTLLAEPASPYLSFRPLARDIRKSPRRSG
jgi:hypothetical protein